MYSCLMSMFDDSGVIQVYRERSAVAVIALETCLRGRKVMFKTNSVDATSLQESVRKKDGKLQYDEWLKKYHAMDRGNWNYYEHQYHREYAKYLLENNMGLFSLSRQRKLEEFCQAMAQKIVLAAHSPDNNSSTDAEAEIVYLLLHLVDRQVLSQLGVSRRDTVFDEVARITITTHTRAVLQADASQDDLMIKAEKMMSTLKSRQSIYFQCKSLFGESSPNNGTIVFALSFFVYRALGHTDRNDADDILAGRRDISDSDMGDFPEPPEIMAAARAVESIIDALQLASDLKHLR